MLGVGIYCIKRGVLTGEQEVSDMLGGRISNQDEDEVEDELDALEAEVKGVKMPDVPQHELPTKESAKERAKARARQRQEEQEVEAQPEGRQAILA